MTKPLQGKVALVTGSARGIGERIARVLAEAGARVALNDLRPADTERATEALRAAGLDVVAVPADVTREPEVVSMVDAVKRRLGGLDLLVNNAGVLLLHDGKKAPIREMTVEEWDTVMAVNLRGTFLCTKHALCEMAATTGEGRRIVNFSSCAAKLGGYFSSASYIASKAGIIGFTKATAREAAPLGVTVNAVAPGIIDAPMTRLSTPTERDAEVARGIPLGRLGSPADVAEAVLYLCSPAASYVTGATLDVNGGWVMD